MPPRTTGSRARRRTVAVAAGALGVAVIAGPVLGSGQPDLATSDADRAVADAAAVPAAEVELLDGIADARTAQDVATLEHHPQAARLARDWAQVMADAEDDDELAACADLDDDAPGPVWHPTDPHLDLSGDYLGDIGEVVGCYADEVDVEAFLANRLADTEHAGELLESDWRHVGVGTVTSDTDAQFSAMVFMDDTAPPADRHGIAGLLAATDDRDPGDASGVLLAGSGEVTDLLSVAPLARGAAIALTTDRATVLEADPVLASQVRHRIDELAASGARVVVTGDEEIVSPRAAAELDAAGHEVRRVAADDYGADPTQPVRLPPEVSDGPHAPAIGALFDARVLIGRADGSFGPSDTFTRAQMASVVARALELPHSGSQPFPDVAGSDHADAIAAVADAGIVEGFTDGTFRPQQPVTRAQLASMLARAFALAVPDGGAHYPDVGGPHADAIAAVTRARIVQGYADGTFGPGDSATRAQAATFVLNTLLVG